MTQPFALTLPVSVIRMGPLSYKVLLILVFLNLTVEARVLASGGSAGFSVAFVQLLQVTHVGQGLLKQHDAEFQEFMLKKLLSWHSLNPLDLIKLHQFFHALVKLML